MDAQGRERTENVDPADQWVLNPDTGEYELRLPSSAPQPAVPGPRRPVPRDTTDRGTGRRTAAPGREVPPQRRRRGTPPEEPAPG
ncbi:LCP family protein, partial [Streptomyces sp. NPDC005009]